MAPFVAAERSHLHDRSSLLFISQPERRIQCAHAPILGWIGAHSKAVRAQHKAVEMTRVMACEVVFWNTFDPSIIEGNRETRLDAYRQVRDQLMTKIKERFSSGTVLNT